MSIENKYRVHEVAKDFGVDTKDITDVMAEYFTAPKNHMQVLENDELNLIFDAAFCAAAAANPASVMQQIDVAVRPSAQPSSCASSVRRMTGTFFCSA